jgi:hypothetical protein
MAAIGALARMKLVSLRHAMRAQADWKTSVTCCFVRTFNSGFGLRLMSTTCTTRRNKARRSCRTQLEGEMSTALPKQCGHFFSTSPPAFAHFCSNTQRHTSWLPEVSCCYGRESFPSITIECFLRVSGVCCPTTDPLASLDVQLFDVGVCDG